MWEIVIKLLRSDVLPEARVYDFHHCQKMNVALAFGFYGREKMNLFKVVLKSKNKWDNKSRNLYVIQPTKSNAIEYVNSVKDEDFEIHKVYYLGYELSARMYKGGKKES